MPTSTTILEPGAQSAEALVLSLPTVDDLDTMTRRIGAPASGTGISGGTVALPQILDGCLAESERKIIEQQRRSWASADFTGERADVGFTLIRYDQPEEAWSAIEPMWEDCLGLNFPLVVDVSQGPAEQLIWNAEVRERKLPTLGSPAYAVQMAGPSVWTDGTTTPLQPIGLMLWVRTENVIGVLEYSSLGTTGDVIDHTRTLIAAAEQANDRLIR